MEYTRKEIKIINRAYALVEYECERFDMKASWMLNDALKRDRRERGSIHSSKALLCDCFAQGYRNPNYKAHMLYTYASGCRDALLTGAAMGSYVPGQVRPTPVPTGVLDACDKAKHVHGVSIHKHLDRITKGHKAKQG